MYDISKLRYTLTDSMQYGYARVSTKKQCASLDFYTCGECSPDKAMQYVIEQLKPKEYNIRVFDR